jgi:hypothetical protein
MDRGRNEKVHLPQRSRNQYATKSRDTAAVMCSDLCGSGSPSTPYPRYQRRSSSP